MKCPKCRTKIPLGLKTCPKCGLSLEKKSGVMHDADCPADEKKDSVTQYSSDFDEPESFIISDNKGMSFAEKEYLRERGLSQMPEKSTDSRFAYADRKDRFMSTSRFVKSANSDGASSVKVSQAKEVKSGRNYSYTDNKKVKSGLSGCLLPILIFVCLALYFSWNRGYLNKPVEKIKEYFGVSSVDISDCSRLVDILESGLNAGSSYEIIKNDIYYLNNPTLDLDAICDSSDIDEQITDSVFQNIFYLSGEVFPEALESGRVSVDLEFIEKLRTEGNTVPVSISLIAEDNNGVTHSYDDLTLYLKEKNGKLYFNFFDY